MSDRTLIQAVGLGKVYGEGAPVRALEGVDLRVEEGEFLAITGPSGSGKSTLLNLLGTLDRPSEGKVVFGGVDLGTLKGDALADFRREKMGFVFQLYYLVPVLTALENVMLPLVPYRRRLGFDLEGRARELLEGVELGERMDHLPGQLSGGEQQRVAIARALVNEPAVILADEPTGNLDSGSGGRIVELLQRLNRERGLTVVLVTHEAALAAKAGRRVRLQDGRLVG